MFPKAAGMGLVSAIFLILVVAVLVVAILSMVRTSGDAFAQDVVAQRAFLAAQSGAELGLNRVFAPAGSGACNNWNWDLTEAGLTSCQAVVRCSSEVVAAVSYYTLESAGRCDLGGVVAERHLLVRAQP